MRYLLHTLGLVGVLTWCGCNSPDAKTCHQKMAEAQNVVSSVESGSVDSLNRSIQMINLAEEACRKAARQSEVEQLGQARSRLEGHLALVEERAERRKSRESLPPGQLEKLLHEGDPNCPKGQGYEHKTSGKSIRCSGPQLVEMTMEQAKRYLTSRNFRVVASSDDTVLTLESGAERYVFRFASAVGGAPATCVVIYARPGISWQEAVARSTGVPPEKLKDGGTVAVQQGRLQLAVDEKNQIARIGHCPS